jgi:O-antigen ligase
MDRERMDGWCARGVLGLVLVILLYSALATGAVRLQEFVVVEWLTVALVVVWGVRFWLNPKHRLLWSPLCWAVLAFVAYALARYFTAEIEFVARQELVRVVVYAVIFYAVVTNLHRQDTTQIVAVTVVCLAAAIAMYGVLQFLTDSDRVWHFLRPAAYTRRGSGTFINPNNLAGYLELALPLALAYTLTGRFDHVTKVLLGYCALVIFAGIAVSVSRGGWLATVLTLMVFFFWLFRQRDYRLQAVLLLVALVAITALFLAKAQFSTNRSDRLVIAQQTEDMRVLLWGPAIQMWKDHFWWGVGPAHFDWRFRQYRPANHELQMRPDRAHNDYLNALADWGTVGGLLLAAVWVIFYVEVFRSWRFVQRAPNDLTTKRSNKTSVVLGGALGLLAILFHSAVDFNLHVPAIALLATTLMGLVAGHFRFATEKYWVTVRLPLRSVVTVVLLAVLVFLGREAWRRSRASLWLARAGTLANKPTEQIVAWQRAFAADRQDGELAYRIGELIRLQSWEGNDDYRELAEAAMKWFQRGMELNPYDAYNHLRYGMCLHWLGRHEEAGEYFERARVLDPNNHYVRAHLGWHWLQLAEAEETPRSKREHYAKAQDWIRSSLDLNSSTNPIARSYEQLIARRLAELPQGN